MITIRVLKVISSLGFCFNQSKLKNYVHEIWELSGLVYSIYFVIQWIVTCYFKDEFSHHQDCVILKITEEVFVKEVLFSIVIAASAVRLWKFKCQMTLKAGSVVFKFTQSGIFWHQVAFTTLLSHSLFYNVQYNQIHKGSVVYCKIGLIEFQPVLQYCVLRTPHLRKSLRTLSFVLEWSGWLVFRRTKSLIKRFNSR